MSKSLSTFGILIFLSFTLSAQQIDSTWFYKAGFSIDHIFNHHPSSADPGPEGTDIIWDFSHAAPDSTSSTITERYVDCGLTSFGDQFPEANFCLSRVSSILPTQEFVSYLKQDENEIREIASSTNVEQEAYPRNSIIMKAGLSLGDTLWNNPDDYYIFDGTGTVITPLDTFENCVRIFHAKYSSTTYNWYQGSMMKQVVSMTPPFYVQGELDDGHIIYMTEFNLGETSAVNQIKDLNERDISASIIDEQLMLSLRDGPINVACSISDFQGRLLHNINSKRLIRGNNYIPLPNLNFTNPLPLIVIIKDLDSPRFWIDQIVSW